MQMLLSTSNNTSSNVNASGIFLLNKFIMIQTHTNRTSPLCFNITILIQLSYVLCGVMLPSCCLTVAILVVFLLFPFYFFCISFFIFSAVLLCSFSHIFFSRFLIKLINQTNVTHLAPNWLKNLQNPIIINELNRMLVVRFVVLRIQFNYKFRYMSMV